jgi:hypothetical protein
MNQDEGLNRMESDIKNTEQIMLIQLYWFYKYYKLIEIAY